MAEIEVPQRWGDDELSAFFKDAHQNVLACFQNDSVKFEWLRDIHRLFRKLTENLSFTDKWVPSLFVSPTHSRYLAAVRTVMGGQAPEGQALLRCCLENALYAHYFEHNGGSLETWVSREDDAESLKRVRDEFTAGAMFKCLESADAKLCVVVRQLYDLTLAYGAHPNVAAVFTRMRMAESDRTVEFTHQVMACHGDAYELALKNCARVGLTALDILRLIWPERFDITGISDELPKLKHSL